CQRYVPIHDYSAGMFLGNLVHQPLANARIGSQGVRRIGEALVAVCDERQGLGQFLVGDFEGGSRFTQKAVGGLGSQRSHTSGEQKSARNKGPYEPASHTNINITSGPRTRAENRKPAACATGFCPVHRTIFLTASEAVSGTVSLVVLTVRAAACLDWIRTAVLGVALPVEAPILVEPPVPVFVAAASKRAPVIAVTEAVVEARCKLVTDAE